MPAKATAPAKPEITRIEPHGVQSGSSTKIKITGKSLEELTSVKFANTNLTGTLLAEPAPKATEAWIEVAVPKTLSRSTQEISVTGKGGESATVKLFVDDLPQVYESSGAKGQPVHLSSLPASYWGTLNPRGDVDEVSFEAQRGQTIVFDLQAKVLGSKAANAMLTLFDASGRVLASNTGFDETGDPLIAHAFEKAGCYIIRVSDAQLGASEDHFYRLSIGSFPYVTGAFPMSVGVGQGTAVELIGYNLPKDAVVPLNAAKAGDQTVAIDADAYRSRRALKVLAVEGVESVESEPNDSPARANPLPVPSSVNGRIHPDRKGQATDSDLFQFVAKGGRKYVLETMAARRNSPVDTKIEVLSADGEPVPRVMLQAVRDSAVTFRPIDSVTVDVRVDHWEEMDLNQFLYMQGEVSKITRMPRGPDSGLNFFGNRGKRRDYFDTTATAHANEEPVYVVEPHPLGTKLVPNGLPTFTLNYVNDDDGERELGSDSRLLFTAPADGSYLVRVADSRGFSGDLFAYRMSIREAKPDFAVTLMGANPKVIPGNGVGFFFRADRMDGFTGEIRMDITGAPSGFGITTPVTIQEDQLEADGTLYAQADAKAPSSGESKAVKISATAMINGQKVVKDVGNFGDIALAAKPKILVKFEKDGAASVATTNLLVSNQPQEVLIAPGQTVSAWIRIERNGDTNLLNMDVDNLPHGIIVDNIGLNGVQVRAGETEREVFLNARPWVQEQDRLIHAVNGSARAADGGAGKQTSFPLLLKVRKPVSKSTASSGR